MQIRYVPGLSRFYVEHGPSITEDRTEISPCFSQWIPRMSIISASSPVAMWRNPLLIPNSSAPQSVSISQQNPARMEPIQVLLLSCCPNRSWIQHVYIFLKSILWWNQFTMLIHFSPPARWGSLDFNKGATPSLTHSLTTVPSSSPEPITISPAPDAVGHAWPRTHAKENARHNAR